jgi:hypothetical protein
MAVSDQFGGGPIQGNANRAVCKLCGEIHYKCRCDFSTLGVSKCRACNETYIGKHECKKGKKTERMHKWMCEDCGCTKCVCQSEKEDALSWFLRKSGEKMTEYKCNKCGTKNVTGIICSCQLEKENKVACMKCGHIHPSTVLCNCKGEKKPVSNKTVTIPPKELIALIQVLQTLKPIVDRSCFEDIVEHIEQEQNRNVKYTGDVLSTILDKAHESFRKIVEETLDEKCEELCNVLKGGLTDE